MNDNLKCVILGISIFLLSLLIPWDALRIIVGIIAGMILGWGIF